MIAASASSIWANAVGGILPQAVRLEMAPAYLRDGDGEGKLHSGSGTGSVDVDSGFSPKAIELLERSGKWSRYTESPGGFISVRNGPGQPEGFQAGFEAAGPGR